MFNWVTVLLSIAINWFVLGVLLMLLGKYFSMFYPFYIDFPYFAEITAGVILSLSIALSFLPPIDTIFKFVYKLRLPIYEEKQRLEPLFREVCKKARIDHRHFNLHICSDSYPNAYALGRNIIAVSRGLLHTATDYEIKAVLAHELAHHQHGDCLATRIYITVSFVGQACLLASRFFKRLLSHAFLKVLFLPAYLILNINLYVLEILLFLPLGIAKIAGSRFQEFKADQFAAQLGYAPALYSYLNKTLDLNFTPLGFWNVLYQTHPSSGKRMRKLERYIYE